MTITLLDLYNTAASQEWSMYDNDAENQSELENSLIIALNKALTEILYKYDFPFRERTHILLTTVNQNNYNMPKGLIKKDKNGNFEIFCNSNNLKILPKNYITDNKTGVPEYFYLKEDKLILYPAPNESSIITINYITLAVGEDTNGNDIYKLSDKDDVIIVPEELENLFINAVISRTMLNSLSSERDENYSAYKKQSEIAFRMLVKYAKRLDEIKSVKI